MNRFQLKMIALISMIIDHAGYILFPDKYWIRLLGRLAFPIYAFFVSEGIKHTRNIKNYLKRLLFFAVVCQVPYTMVTYLNSNTIYINTIFTLFFGSLGIYLYEKYKNIIFLLMGIILAYISKSDYQIFGVLLIYMFYFVGNNLVIASILILIKEPTVNLLKTLILTRNFSILESSINTYYLFSPLFIIMPFLILKLYNGDKGYNVGYFFYVMYPLHFLILELINFLFFS